MRPVVPGSARTAKAGTHHGEWTSSLRSEVIDSASFSPFRHRQTFVVRDGYACITRPQASPHTGCHSRIPLADA
eukprot:19769-Eustigmatos_ZCMA.PRE.1